MVGNLYINELFGFVKFDRLSKMTELCPKNGFCHENLTKSLKSDF